MNAHTLKSIHAACIGLPRGVSPHVDAIDVFNVLEERRILLEAANAYLRARTVEEYDKARKQMMHAVSTSVLP